VEENISVLYNHLRQSGQSQLWKKEEETELVLSQWELKIPISPFHGFNRWKQSEQHDVWEVESDEQYTFFMRKIALPQENRLFHS
jgi:hypothetical protein